MEKGYLLKNSSGQFNIVDINILSKEDIAIYKNGLKDEEIILTGLTKASYKNKPFYYSEGSLGLTPGVNYSAEELKAKIDMTANKRFWKYVGQRNIDMMEILFIMGFGYTVVTLIVQLIHGMFPGVV